MAVTNGWGQAAKDNTNGYGKLATNNIGAGSIYEDSWAGDTALIGVTAGFSYAKSSYENNEADPTPTITGTTGGTFSAGSGLVFVDSGSNTGSSTGQIDLSATTVAAYTITYTVSGVSSNVSLSVTQAFVNDYSMSFDGVNDYIDLTQHDLGTVNSISFWLKRANTDTVGETIFGEPSNAYKQLVYIDWNAELFYYKDPANNKSIWDISASNDTDWHHYLVTRNGTATILYVDGAALTLDGSSGTLSGNTMFRYLAVNYNTNSQYFEGNISNCAIWNSALSAANVTTLYNSGKPSDLSSFSPAPVAWWQLGENSYYDGSDWIVLDEIGTNNGTSSGMTEDDLVDGVQTTANGVSSGMGTTNIKGDAPYSTNNAISYNMGVTARETSTP